MKTIIQIGLVVLLMIGLTSFTACESSPIPTPTPTQTHTPIEQPPLPIPEPKPEQPLKPADITVAGLTANPPIATWDEVITITAKLVNTGDLEGTYNAVLKLNNKKQYETSVTVPGTGTKYVSFQMKGGLGNYNASVGEMNVGLTVVKPTPAYKPQVPVSIYQPAYQPPPVYSPPLYAPNTTTDMEKVLVYKVLDFDSLIISRSNGQKWILEKGIGCLSLDFYEGRFVYIYSPGLFAGIGSKIFILERDQECRIWNSEFLP